MTRCVRSILFVSLILIALAGVATADIIQDLTVSLYQGPPCEPNCFVDTGDQGSPAGGYYDFTSRAIPWGFAFETGDALSWSETQYSYEATFGQGGYFDMTGPYGLTFTGVVTSGAAAYMDDIGIVEVYFSGQWSDGIKASGYADVYYSPFPFYGDLDTRAVAPEPSSLALMASGVLGIWGGKKRLWSRMNRL